jgi:putative oxidoreductase
MRNSALLGLRLTLGGYLAVHGAQKLFGSFDGPGLEKAGAGFEHLGLQPGKAFAALAGGSELTGGILTAIGAAYPVGPLALAGAMSVASLAHLDKGPMLQKGGYELPATNMAAALLLIGTGPGRFSFDHVTGLRLPKALIRLAVFGATVLTAYSAAKVVQSKQGLAPAADASADDSATEPAIIDEDGTEAAE